MTTLVLAIAFLLFLPAGCFADRPEQYDSISLLDGLPSKSSPSEVQSSLAIEDSKWKIIFREKIKPEGMTHPVDVVRIEVLGHMSLGSSGRLLLTFNDDLLTRTVFCPNDLPSYVRKAEAEFGAELSGHRDGHQDNGRVIWVTTHQPEYQCVGWRDQHLTRRFSSSN